MASREVVFSKERRLTCDVVLSRDEAKAQGLPQFYTGRPCRRGHVAPRLVSNWTCLDCQNESYRKAKAADPARFSEYNKKNCRAHYRRHPEKSKAYYRQNLDAARERSRMWAAANRERVRHQKAAHRKRNPHKMLEYAQRRRGAARRAMPQWLTQEQIAEMQLVYLDAATRPGGPWHVDHIVPLLGKNVCGLHVPWNLRVISAQENWSKGAKLIPELIEP